MGRLRRDDGVELHYQTRGTGPVIILSHGMGVTSRMWDPQCEALSDNHTLVLWDMRGHGESDAPTNPELYSEAATVADITALLDHVGAQQAVVGGLSLGGYMSLAFYRDHPDRCGALLLFDCGPGYRNDRARDRWNDWAHQSAARYESQTLEEINGPNTELTGRHRSREGLAHAARRMLTQRDDTVMNTLARIDVPTLLVHGDHDENFIEPMEYMRNKIPMAYRAVAPAAGHYPNIDRPELVNAALLWFLATLPQERALDWYGKGAPRRQR
jgi:pimeloyl-ACP methyl ester carboxylesterase